jgi:hypothetical protein
MARKDFIDQLKALNYQVEELPENRLAFDYRVPVGKFAGKDIRLGFVVADDFPQNPPSGPHVSPRLLPLQSGGQHPSGGINASPFGEDWEYWSRPFQGWAGTDRSVKAYLAFIRQLFDTQ